MEGMDKPSGSLPKDFSVHHGSHHPKLYYQCNRGGGALTGLNKFRSYWTARGVIPRWQLIGVYIVVVAAGSYGLGETRQIAEQGQRSEIALCVLRTDLKNRVINQEQFLKDNPKGVLGIPRNIIIQSIISQKRTIVSLKLLDCDK